MKNYERFFEKQATHDEILLSNPDEILSSSKSSIKVGGKWTSAQRMSKHIKCVREARMMV